MNNKHLCFCYRITRISTLYIFKVLSVISHFPPPNFPCIEKISLSLFDGRKIVYRKQCLIYLNAGKLPTALETIIKN